MNDIEKAIERLKNISDNYIYYNLAAGNAEDIDLAISALEKQLNGGWIPVSERLPSEEECNRFDIRHPNRRKFLCTVKIGDYEPQVRELYFTLFYNWSDGSENYDKYVIAWQPLPETYKEA